VLGDQLGVEWWQVAMPIDCLSVLVIRRVHMTPGIEKGPRWTPHYERPVCEVNGETWTLQRVLETQSSIGWPGISRTSAGVFATPGVDLPGPAHGCQTRSIELTAAFLPRESS
jgi:hypothetical protein